MAEGGAFESLLDTVRSYETPEGIALELRLAGPVVRALAWIIDLGIRVALYLALIYGLALFGGVGTGLMLIGLFLIEWFYPTLFEVLRGATPGKQAMGLTVIHDNGTPLGWAAGLIRNLRTTWARRSHWIISSKWEPPS